MLPTSFGTRPRLAIEVRPEGVVAARAEESSSVIAANSRAEFPAGTAVPLLRPGTIAAHTAGETPAPTPAIAPAHRAALIAAVRKALEAVAQRSRETTVVVPDSAVRVLLLDFDELPGKPAEALPVVRFRLKKLLPFDADEAAISYQVMSATRGLVRVLAVAMPREILADYENIVREAGFEPGAVLPSTLAALAGLPEGDTPSLLVNIGRNSVTTAIVRNSLLLLHRSIDLRTEEPALRTEEPALRTEEPALRTGEPALRSDVYLDPLQVAARIQTAELIRETELEPVADLTSAEVAQAVSVAAAYFEDTLETAPDALLCAGTLSARALESLLADAGLDGVPVREIVDPAMLTPGANGRATMGLLAGVRGALAS